MKPSSNTLLPKQSGQDISTLMHISTLDDHVYRYSYNLGMLDLRAKRKENAMIFAGRRPVKIQRRTHKFSALDRLESEQIHNIDFPTKIDVAPLKNCPPVETEIIDNGQENVCKVQEVILPKKICVNVCKEETNDPKETLETFTTETTRISPVPNTEQVCITKDGEEETDFNAQILPAIEKFRRAARVLGVCLPPQELYCLQRRNGICEGNSIEHKTLLRILNKRF